jgi:putative isomerase
MNRLKIFILLAVIAGMFLNSCKAGDKAELQKEDLTLNFPNLLNVVHTPQGKVRQGQGYFTDCGSWMGFSIPGKEAGISGFCGPCRISIRLWQKTRYGRCSIIRMMPG